MFAFQRALVPSLCGVDAVIVHMVPQFLLLAAAPARIRRVPLLLWYTHWHASRSLRAATALARLVLSVDHASFPLETSKLRGIGHAIDVGMFNAEPASAHDGPLRLLTVGRTARWKGIATLLRAMSIVLERGVDVSLEVRGPSLSLDEVAHRAELAQLIEDDPRLRERVRLADAVPRAELPKLLESMDAVVSPNEPRSGATFDKAVFEAAACARLVVSTNEAFAPLLAGLELPLLAPPSDPPALADVLGESRRRAATNARASGWSFGDESSQGTRSITGRLSDRGRSGGTIAAWRLSPRSGTQSPSRTSARRDRTS